MHVLIAHLAKMMPAMMLTYIADLDVKGFKCLLKPSFFTVPAYSFYQVSFSYRKIANSLFGILLLYNTVHHSIIFISHMGVGYKRVSARKLASVATP